MPILKRKASSTADSSRGRSGGDAGRSSLPPSDYYNLPVKRAKTSAFDSNADNIKTPTKRQRKTKGPPIQQRAIPRSFNECDPADRLLIVLRDAGTEWEEIVRQWKELTGETKVGKSTLPNRYNRLKENFSVIREEDNARLFEAKREVEEAFEKSKWARIAAIVRTKGGEDYPGVVLQRQYKKFMLGIGVRPPTGVIDKDFEGAEEEHADGEGRGEEETDIDDNDDDDDEDNEAEEGAAAEGEDDQVGDEE